MYKILERLNYYKFEDQSFLNKHFAFTYFYEMQIYSSTTASYVLLIISIIEAKENPAGIDIRTIRWLVFQDIKFEGGKNVVN